MGTKLFAIFILAYCAKLGLSLQCRQCWGNADDCNNSTAKVQDCPAGKDMCSSMKVMKDGKETRLYGCATQNDCLTGKKACTSAEETPRTSCNSTCCQSSFCNAPPVKENKLKCYTCQSASSMDDCVQNSKAMTCTTEETKCGKFTTELMIGDHKVMVYRKGCRSEKACEETNDLFGQACGSSGSKCDHNCCGGDLCNAGIKSYASVLLMLVCSILPLLNM